MTGVYYYSRTNSTLFTKCCNCAVTDSEKACPQCQTKIYPESARGRHESAMKQLYGADGLKQIRRNQNRKY